MKTPINYELANMQEKIAEETNRQQQANQTSNSGIDLGVGDIGLSLSNLGSTAGDFASRPCVPANNLVMPLDQSINGPVQNISILENGPQSLDTVQNIASISDCSVQGIGSITETAASTTEIIGQSAEASSGILSATGEVIGAIFEGLGSLSL